MRDSLVLGNNGNLTSGDKEMIAAHFICIVNILKHAGMDRVHIFEYLMSLGHAWWMSSL